MIACNLTAHCRVCSQQFERRNSMHRVCSPGCAMKLVRAAKKAEASDRKETKAKLEAIKPRAKWLAEAQQAFNAYIRLRDAALPCVSCLRHHRGQYHAGHYLTVGARPELRFDEQNVHKQCSACNEHLHGNLVLYRLELLMRIGATSVARLEGPHPPVKYSVDELRTIRDTYRAKARDLKRQHEQETAS